MNAYRRKIPTAADGTSDVYDVLVGFGVTNPATAHALKKLLCAGQRGGGKSVMQDLEEARTAIGRAMELERGWANQ